MKLTVVSGNDLSDDLLATWARLQEANPALANPFFRPEFVAIVAKVRNDVFVGVLEELNQVVGFFPFHRRRGGIGRPIGLRLSDYHGVIVEPGAEWSVEPLLKACGLVRFEFDHLPAGQTPFIPYRSRIADSPIIELAAGYEAFEASRDRSGRKFIREALRKRGRLHHEVGPVRFVEHVSGDATLRTLMQWKSAQCMRAGIVDFFAIPWCSGLIERIHTCREKPFGGLLSCLYAGDALVATHFVLRSERVWHSWFPAYAPAFHAYSPGTILLLEMIRAAEARGIAYIDLGKDMSLYKRRFMTGAIRVAEGCVEMPSVVNHAKHLRDRVEQWSKRSVWRPVLRLPGRILKGIERRAQYE